MAIPLFYDKNIPPDAKEWLLSEEETLHLAKVLRLRLGDEVELTNGKGTTWKATFTSQLKKQALLTLSDKRTQPPKHGYYLHIGIAPTKNIDRTEWFVEKATEIGINQITFLKTTHSERKEINLDRLERIAIAAVKQSQRYEIPILQGMVGFASFLEEQKALSIQKFICEVPQNSDAMLAHRVSVQTPICALVGPEGGFSPEELKTAQSLGFLQVGLGNTRLRTETAGVYIATILSIRDSLKNIV